MASNKQKTAKAKNENETKANDTTEKTNSTQEADGQIKVELDAPVNDPGRRPRKDTIGRKERREKRDINAEQVGEDRVYGIASRARWGGTDSIHELAQDAAKAEQSAAENQE